MEIKEFQKKDIKKLPTEKMDELVRKLRKEHEKPVKGMFEFLDADGGWLDFTYRFFKGDPIFQIRLYHGEICELPMGIVKHLNNTKKKIRKLGELSRRGLPEQYEVKSRVRFTPMEVM